MMYVKALYGKFNIAFKLKKKKFFCMILQMRSENCHRLLMEIKQSADTNYASSK